MKSMRRPVGRSRNLRSDRRDTCARPEVLSVTGLIEGSQPEGERRSNLDADDIQWSEGQIADPSFPRDPMVFRIVLADPPGDGQCVLLQVHVVGLFPGERLHHQLDAGLLGGRRQFAQRGDQWIDMTGGYSPSPGDRLRTEDPAGATIRLEEGSRFTISHRSLVEFRGTRGPSAVLRLLEGDVGELDHRLERLGR